MRVDLSAALGAVMNPLSATRGTGTENAAFAAALARLTRSEDTAPDEAEPLPETPGDAADSDAEDAARQDDSGEVDVVGPRGATGRTEVEAFDLAATSSGRPDPGLLP